MVTAARDVDPAQINRRVDAELRAARLAPRSTAEGLSLVVSPLGGSFVLDATLKTSSSGREILIQSETITADPEAAKKAKSAFGLQVPQAKTSRKKTIELAPLIYRKKSARVEVTLSPVNTKTKAKPHVLVLLIQTDTRNKTARELKRINLFPESIETTTIELPEL
jgi:hypothetical protein